MIRPPPRSPPFPYTTLFRSLPRRPPRDRRALLPERPHARATARRVGRQARRLPLPPAALESGPRGGAGGDAGGARAGTLHPPVRPRRRREPVRRERSEEHTSELQSLAYLVCRLLLEKK